MAPCGNQLVSISDSELKQGKCGQRDREVDLGHKEDGKNAISEIDDVDIEMQLCYGEAFSDENDCTWLSSGGMPPSFQRSDNPQSADVLEVDFCDLLLYYQFSAISPMFRGDGAFFDVAQRNPVPDESCTNSMEASLVLERKNSCAAECQNDNFLGGNVIKYSSLGYLEGVQFCDRCSFCEDSSSVDSSWSSLGTCEEPSSLQEYDLDIINIWLPLLDLEGKEPNWDADAFDGLDQDFPGPSCHRQTSLQTRFSSCSYIQASKQLLDVQASLGSPSTIFNPSPEHALDVKSLPKDLDAGEPLFWPFDQKSYWSTELEWNYLGISPPGSILKIRRPTRCHAPKSVQFRLHQRNNSSLHGKSIQRRHKGRVSFSSISSQSHLAGHESGDPSSRISSDTGIPSGLSRSTGLPSDDAICSLSKKEGIKGHSKSISPRIRHGVNQKTSLDKYLLEFEADDFRIYLAGEIPIETLVGLDEFDGHEGIRTMAVGWSMEDFNEDPLL